MACKKKDCECHMCSLFLANSSLFDFLKEDLAELSQTRVVRHNKCNINIKMKVVYFISSIERLSIDETLTIKLCGQS